MSTKRTIQYQPTMEQLALFPDISGNTINGLGETIKRRPSPIYWIESEKSRMVIYKIIFINKTKSFSHIGRR